MSTFPHKTSSSSDRSDLSSSAASESTAARSQAEEGVTSSSEIKQEDRSSGLLPTRYRRQTRSYTKKRKATEAEDGVAETNASLWDGGVITYGGGERHLKFR